MMNTHALGTLIQSPSNSHFDRSYAHHAPPIDSPSIRFRPTNNHTIASTLSEFETSNLRQHHQPSPEHHTTLLHDLPTLTSCIPSPEFLTARNTHKAERQYTLRDWKVLKNDNFQASDRIKAGAELSRADVGRVIGGVEMSMEKNQKNSLKGIEDCEKNINHWKDEVEKEMAKVGESIGDLEKEEVRLERVLDGCEKVLEVVMGCLEVRGERQEIERVVDVDPDLIKEAQMLRDLQRDVRNLLLAVTSHIGHNKQLRQEMSASVMRMYEGSRLLSKCQGMTEGTDVYRSHLHHKASQRPICWSDEATSLVERSKKQRADSQSLIDTSGELTDNQSQAFLRQWQGTNEKLSFRLEDYRGALHGLDSHLARTLGELAEIERVREEIKKLMRKRGEVVCLAQARKETLVGGGVVENGEPFMVEEPGKALKRLWEEIRHLGESSEELLGKLREVGWVEGVLCRTKRSLEHDITLKKLSEHLDEEVVGRRKRINVMSLIPFL